MPTYLVTGGAGFIGSHLTDLLCQQGHRVVVFDNFSTGVRRNLAAVRHQITVHEGDIRNKRQLRRALRGVDYVFHLAALTSVSYSMQHPNVVNDVNIEGTLNVLEEAARAGVERLIFASSCAVYSDVGGPVREDTLPQPASPYAISKLVGEYYCHFFTQAHQLPTVVLRYFNIFGPRQNIASSYAAVIPRFITALRSHQRAHIYGDGEQQRDFTYVGDVVQANLLALRARRAPGQIINIGTGKTLSINALYARLQTMTGSKLKPRYFNARVGDIAYSRANIQKARLILKYQPRVTLAAGLQHTVQSWK